MASESFPANGAHHHFGGMDWEFQICPGCGCPTLMQIDIGRAARRVRDNFDKGDVNVYCPRGHNFIFPRSQNRMAFDPRDKAAIAGLESEVSTLKDQLEVAEKRLRDVGGNVVPMRIGENT